jgi:hypothetical protein
MGDDNRRTTSVTLHRGTSEHTFAPRFTENGKAVGKELQGLAREVGLTF